MGTSDLSVCQHWAVSSASPMGNGGNSPVFGKIARILALLRHVLRKV